MTTAALPRVALRPLAIPNEHGGWGILLEPVVLALAVAPSTAGLALSLALVAAFFLRHPLRFAVRDLMLGKRYPRTIACGKLALAYGTAALILFAMAVAMASGTMAIPLLVVSPFLAVQFFYDVRNRGRELTPELCGAIAAAAGGAACVMAGRGGASLAMLIAILALCRSVPSVLYVRSLLRGSSAVPGVFAHVLAVVGVALFAPAAAIAVPLALLARCVAGHLRRGLTARRVGVEEVAWGVVATVVLATLVR
jgi:uncharacterized membrane protein HdeD (DUF308 family)